MSTYVEHAKNTNLLEENYTDLVTLAYDDILDKENINLLIATGDYSTQSLDLIDFAVAGEAKQVTDNLQETWDDVWGEFDYVEAIDEIGAYINDHFEQDVDRELAANTDPVIVYSRVMDEDYFDDVSDDGSEVFIEQYADKIVNTFGFSPNDRPRVVDLLNNVHGYVYTVAVAGKIDPEVLTDDVDDVVFENPSVVVGDFITGDLWADEFDGSFKVYRFSLIKGDIIDDTHGGFHTDCTVTTE